MNRASISLLAIVAMLVGCSDRSQLLEGVATVPLRLEMEHTGGADLELTVPKGYVVDWTRDAVNDNFLIYDPSDSGAVQRGMILINVAPETRFTLDHSAPIDSSRGRVAGTPVRWYEAIYVNDDGVRVHQREFVDREVMGKLASPGDNAGLKLHALVSGQDSMLVERLMACVETLRAAPVKANL